MHLMLSKSIIILLAGCSVKISEQSEVKFELCDGTLSNQKTPKSKIGGYYWRPYTGIIPSDAIPAGRTKLFNVSYIGAVYDPANKGEFVANIYPGKKEVVISLNVTSIRVDQIQILCSQEKENFKWLTLEDSNNKGGDLIKGGSRVFYEPFFVARTTTKYNNVYAGQVYSTDTGIEYTNIVSQYGFNTNMTEYEMLYYFNTTGNQQNAEEDGSETYSLDTPLDYYWRPQIFLYVPPDAFSIGTQYNNYSKEVEKINVGQGYLSKVNQMIQGTYGPLRPFVSSATQINGTYSSLNVQGNGKILCTSNKNTFKWVKTTITDVPKLFPKAVLGGYTNISAVYVSRFIRNKDTFEARLYALGDKGTPKLVYNDDDFVYSDETKFELLTYSGTRCFNV